MFAALTKQGMTAWKCDAAYFANGAGCAFETRTQIVSQTPGQTREEKIREFNPMKTTGISV
jgi:hypothetical protein